MTIFLAPSARPLAGYKVCILVPTDIEEQVRRDVVKLGGKIVDYAWVPQGKFMTILACEDDEISIAFTSDDSEADDPEVNRYVRKYAERRSLLGGTFQPEVRGVMTFGTSGMLRRAVEYHVWGVCHVVGVDEDDILGMRQHRQAVTSRFARVRVAPRQRSTSSTALVVSPRSLASSTAFSASRQSTRSDVTSAIPSRRRHRDDTDDSDTDSDRPAVRRRQGDTVTTINDHSDHRQTIYVQNVQNNYPVATPEVEARADNTVGIVSMILLAGWTLGRICR